MTKKYFLLVPSLLTIESNLGVAHPDKAISSSGTPGGFTVP